jgi:hypothetical protein
MIRKKINDSVYAAMGYPDLGSRIFLLKDGKRIFGKVCLLSFIGFKGAKNGKVLIGIEPSQKPMEKEMKQTAIQ